MPSRPSLCQILHPKRSDFNTFLLILTYDFIISPIPLSFSFLLQHHSIHCSHNYTGFFMNWQNRHSFPYFEFGARACKKEVFLPLQAVGQYAKQPRSIWTCHCLASFFLPQRPRSTKFARFRKNGFFDTHTLGHFVSSSLTIPFRLPLSDLQIYIQSLYYWQ